MFEPKIGDVVSLRSDPEVRMTVIGYNVEKKMYDVIWLSKDNNLQGIGITPAALQKVESEVFDPDKHPAVQARLAELGEHMGKAVEALHEVDALRTELGDCKRSVQHAIGLVRVTLSELPADSDIVAAVSALAITAQTWKREGNEQIAALRAKL